MGDICYVEHGDGDMMNVDIYWTTAAAVGPMVQAVATKEGREGGGQQHIRLCFKWIVQIKLIFLLFSGFLDAHGGGGHGPHWIGCSARLQPCRTAIRTMC